MACFDSQDEQASEQHYRVRADVFVCHSRSVWCSVLESANMLLRAWPPLQRTVRGGELTMPKVRAVKCRCKDIARPLLLIYLTPVLQQNLLAGCPLPHFLSRCIESQASATEHGVRVPRPLYKRVPRPLYKRVPRPLLNLPPQAHLTCGGKRGGELTVLTHGHGESRYGSATLRTDVLQIACSALPLDHHFK
jgi:hypothetical protein